jgi:hypothetical protein
MKLSDLGSGLWYRDHQMHIPWPPASQELYSTLNTRQMTGFEGGNPDGPDRASTGGEETARGPKVFAF